MINETHDRELTSWVPGAQGPGADFPIQNLPYGAFLASGDNEPRLGVAIGDYVLDLRAVSKDGLLEGISEAVASACQETTLNTLMGLGSQEWSALRLALSRLLRSGSDKQGQVQAHIRRQSDVELVLPARIGDYTDFYSSIHHATNAGRLFRPENPLFPNYEYLPVGYHGRASSVVASGQAFRRPWGQRRTPDATDPVFAPSAKMDFELELGFYVGPGNDVGQPIPIGRSEEHIFGVCILNDWSARDIQAWEYQPLGPFLGKSFLTTVSPWVVTMEALAPFRQAMVRDKTRPAVPQYLSDRELEQRSALDIDVEVAIETEAMRAQGKGPEQISRAPFVEQFWSIYQMLTHHASNGCNLRPGDLMGTGTISGTGAGEEGCLLEKTQNGARPMQLSTGETRQFLEDGDEVIMRAHCKREGFVSIGFGECRGRIEPAVE